MEIRTTEEVRTNIEEFTKRLLSLKRDQKSLADDIKALKQEYKEEGVPVSIVTGVVTRIMQEKKKSDGDKFEEETIKEWLETNPQIDDEIGALAAS